MHEFKGIFNQAKLDFIVKWGVSGKGGRMVDLNKLGLFLMIEHNVKSNYMKAHTVGVVFRLAALVLMCH